MTHRRWLAVAALLALALAAIALQGCASTKETTQQQEETIIERKPTPDGGYIERRKTYGSSEKNITSKVDADWNGAISRGVGAAMTGDWVTLGGIGGTLVMAAGAAWSQHRRAKEHKDDAAEGWSKYEAAMRSKSDA